MKIAVFASGNGSNFENLVCASRDGRMPHAEIVLMVCDHPEDAVCDRARRLGVEIYAFSPKQYVSKDAYEEQIVQQLQAHGIELVCLAGYMRIVGPTLLTAYHDRMINLHPSLLPSFRGAHAIEQALAYGVKVFGVTLHFVSEELDGGRIIAQQAFPYEGHDLDALTEQVHATERTLYIETVNKIIKGEIR